MIVTVHYGIDNIPKAFSGESITVGEVVGNQVVKTALGYGDNIKAMVSGVEVPFTSHLTDGEHLHIEVRANSKAVTAEKLEATANKLDHLVLRAEKAVLLLESLNSVLLKRI